jgi:hypothetical protein
MIAEKELPTEPHSERPDELPLSSIGYSRRELDEVISGMESAASVFYRMAQRIGYHQFIEVTGFMNEMVKLCRNALAQGIDFIADSPFPITEPEAMYIGEKFGCIFGEAFARTANPAQLINAFCRSAFGVAGGFNVRALDPEDAVAHQLIEKIARQRRTPLPEHSCWKVDEGVHSVDFGPFRLEVSEVAGGWCWSAHAGKTIFARDVESCFRTLEAAQHDAILSTAITLSRSVGDLGRAYR